MAVTLLPWQPPLLLAVILLCLLSLLFLMWLLRLNPSFPAPIDRTGTDITVGTIGGAMCVHCWQACAASSGCVPLAVGAPHIRRKDLGPLENGDLTAAVQGNVSEAWMDGWAREGGEGC